MTKLSAKERNKLPASKFALPKERAYPINSKSHAANAKARASQMVKVGKLSPAKKEKIDVRANKVLHQRKPSVKRK